MERFFERFEPENYKLFLSLEDVKRRSFAGDVTISGKVKNKNYVSFHTKDLVIEDVVLERKSKMELPWRLEFEVLPEKDELRVFPKRKKTGENFKFDEDVKISIEFSGKITDSMHGLYPCYYEENGIKKEMFATQFESHHAREVFPCVDEPEAKATFDLLLVFNPDVSPNGILGNMPAHITQDEFATIANFEQTPKMSTYLLAFAFGDLQKKSAKTKNDVEVSVWSTKAQKPELLDFPLKVAVDVLEFYEDYFGVKFPLKKCDHLALPDFSSGAMENWGLITYRETALLAGKESAISSMKYVALVVAHETSHQWFGNLVTMKWWDDLWLNESFATMMEYAAVDKLFPQWNIWEEFMVNESMFALRRDSIDGVQSVKVEVKHPDEIGTIFDGAIVYAKGARLMNMLKSYVGEDDFRKGLHNYFEKFAYNNTIGSDLWKCLSEASGKNISEFMNKWLEQPGFPVVNVKISENNLMLSQKQFFSGAGVNKNRIWPILLNANHSNLPQIFDKKDGRLDFNFKDKEDYLIINKGNISHILVNYDDELLRRIVWALENGKLDPISRLQILLERSILARGGVAPDVSILSILQTYKQESDLYVWSTVSSCLGDLMIFIDNDSVTEMKMRKFVGILFRGKFSELTLKRKLGESQDETQLRPLIISNMIYSQDKQVVRGLLDIYHEADNISGIDSEIRMNVLINKVKEEESPELIDKLIRVYKEAADVDVKEDILGAVTSTKYPETAKKVLHMIIDEKLSKPQDIAGWYVNFLRNSKTQETAWKWLLENWKWIEKTFSGDKSYDDFIRYSGAILKTKEQLKEFNDFFLPMMSDIALKRSIEMGQIEIQAKIDRIARSKDEIEAFLHNF